MPSMTGWTSGTAHSIQPPMPSSTSTTLPEGSASSRGCKRDGNAARVRPLCCGTTSPSTTRYAAAATTRNRRSRPGAPARARPDQGGPSIAWASSGASTTAPRDTIRVTRRIQPAATRSSSRCVQGVPPRRAHSTASSAIMAAATRAGTVRNDVGPHSAISDVRADTANCEVSSLGPAGVSAVTANEASGTANASTIRRPRSRRSSTSPTQQTRPRTTPGRPQAVGGRPHPGQRHQPPRDPPGLPGPEPGMHGHAPAGSG